MYTPAKTGNTSPVCGLTYSCKQERLVCTPERMASSPVCCLYRWAKKVHIRERKESTAPVCEARCLRIQGKWVSRSRTTYRWATVWHGLCPPFRSSGVWMSRLSCLCRRCRRHDKTTTVILLHLEVHCFFHYHAIDHRATFVSLTVFSEHWHALVLFASQNMSCPLC